MRENILAFYVRLSYTVLRKRCSEDRKWFYKHAGYMVGKAKENTFTPYFVAATSLGRGGVYSKKRCWSGKGFLPY